MPRIVPRRTSPYLISSSIVVPREVARHGEADPLVAAGLAVDRGVDPDQLAARVDQRAAGVAGVDRGVGLDEVLVVATRPFEAAAGRADDAERDRLVETGTDCRSPAPTRRPCSFDESPQRSVGRLRGVDLQHREVGRSVDADDLGAAARACRRGSPTRTSAPRAADDVVVGEDVAVGRDDDAGAEALRPPLAIQVVVAEEVAGRTGRWRTAMRDDLRRRDVGDAADRALRRCR